MRAAVCPRGPHKDRFEVKRVGSQSTKVTITFEQDFVPPVYRVDPQLAEVSRGLGMPLCVCVRGGMRAATVDGS